MDNEKRLVFLDWLRACACFMVMAIHACEPFYLGGEAPNVTSIANRWDMLWITVTECLCRCCVPLFAMTSAYLLFPTRKSAGEFLKRRMVRVLVPFAIWSVLYVACFGNGAGAWGKVLFNFPDEGGHLWFVPMVFGLYLLMPLLSPWAEKVGVRELKGWLALWLATTSFPFLRVCWSMLFGEPSFGAVPYLWGECPWNHFGAFHYVSGFFGYMLLGLWMRRFAPELDWRRTLCIAVPAWTAGVALMGIPFFLFVRDCPFAAPYGTAVVMETSIEYCTTGVALTTFAVFLMFRRIDFGGWLYEKVVRPVSDASYGMYLMHMFILPLASAHLKGMVPTPFAIAGTAVATFVLSALAALLLRRIPVAGRWLCG